MTYKMPERIETLTFDGYDGLEVKVRLSPVPFAAYLDVVATIDENKDADSLRRIADTFAAHGLVGWNLDVPADADGLLRIDFTLAIGIVIAWIGKVGEVPVPLPSASSSTRS
jgi:hypothetical protein